MRTIYVLEHKFEDGRWVPMYQPCYSISDARKKIGQSTLYRRDYKNGILRIAAYVFTQVMDQK